MLPQGLASVTARRNLDQRSSEIREFAGIEDLDTRVALPVEGGGARRAGLRSVGRGIEPEAQVVSMDPSRHRTQRSIRKSVVEYDRSLNTGQRNNKGLDAETADEPAVALSVPIGLDVPLVPG
jgi:hypothetical protein